MILPQSRKKSRGSSTYSAVTLIESILYLALFAMLFIGLMQFYFSVGESNRRSTASLMLQKNRIFLSEHIEESIRKSVQLDQANSTVSVNESIFRLDMGGSYVEYYLDEGTLMVTNGVTVAELTPPNIEVSRFRVSVSDNPTSDIHYVEFIIELRDGNIATVTQRIDLFYIMP